MIYDKILLGVTFAAPVGPVTAEAIRRGLLGGFAPAFKVKMGAAIGDTIFILVTYFCIAALLRYVTFCHLLALFGSALLLYVGYKNIRKSFVKQADAYDSQENLSNGMWIGLAIALTSPFALAWWLSVFSAVLTEGGGATTFEGFKENLYIVVGIVAWDIAFCTLLAGGKRLVNDSMIKVITGLAGLSLCIFGIKFGVAAFKNILL